MLKPLRPQSEKKIKWERDVLNHLIRMLEIPNGDAQGIYEVQAFKMDAMYADGVKPLIAAKRLDILSKGGR